MGWVFLRNIGNQCFVNSRGRNYRYVPYSLFSHHYYDACLPKYCFSCSLGSLLSLKIFRFLYLHVLQLWFFQSNSYFQVLVLLENNLLTGINYTCNLLKLVFPVWVEQPGSLHQDKVWEVLSLSWGAAAPATQRMCVQSEKDEMYQLFLIYVSGVNSLKNLLLFVSAVWCHWRSTF